MIGIFVKCEELKRTGVPEFGLAALRKLGLEEEYL